MVKPSVYSMAKSENKIGKEAYVLKWIVWLFDVGLLAFSKMASNNDSAIKMFVKMVCH